MQSEVLIAARKGRPADIECRGAVQGRRTGPDVVHLVSNAAGPLGGDEIRTRVIVEAGARLRLRSVAASLALPGAANVVSHAHWVLEVAGSLDLDPQPTVVAANARHLTCTRLQFTDTATVRLRERVQVGRTAERNEGYWSGTMHADLLRDPLLRHRVELGAGSVADDIICSPRAHVGQFDYPSVGTDAAGVVLELAGGGYLANWQGAGLGDLAPCR